LGINHSLRFGITQGIDPRQDNGTFQASGWVNCGVGNPCGRRSSPSPNLPIEYLVYLDSKIWTLVYGRVSPGVGSFRLAAAVRGLFARCFWMTSVSFVHQFACAVLVRGCCFASGCCCSSAQTTSHERRAEDPHGCLLERIFLRPNHLSGC
jgi:hypothetical protein